MTHSLGAECVTRLHLQRDRPFQYLSLAALPHWQLLTIWDEAAGLIDRYIYSLSYENLVMSNKH